LKKNFSLEAGLRKKPEEEGRGGITGFSRDVLGRDRKLRGMGDVLRAGHD